MAVISSSDGYGEALFSVGKANRQGKDCFQCILIWRKQNTIKREKRSLSVGCNSMKEIERSNSFVKRRHL
jgi:uncharacterized protein YeaC (DUF1315 family)